MLSRDHCYFDGNNNKKERIVADFSVEFSQSSNGPILNIKHRADKQRSEPFCTFQGLGIIYRIADALVRFDQSLLEKAVEFVRSQLSQGGWPEQTVDTFLAAPDWKSRMLTAWCLLDEEARQGALQLDYTVFVNYWPNHAFMQPDWEWEVKQWSESSTDIMCLGSEQVMIM